MKKVADVAFGRTEPGPTNDGTIGSKEDSGRGSVSLAIPSVEREGATIGGNHGDAPRAKHAATQEWEAEASQHGLTLLQPTVVEISVAVVDKAKAGEHDSMEDLQHSFADVGGSPPSVGRGRRRQRRSDGKEEYDTAVPGDINTRSKRRQTTGGADNADGAEVGTTQGAMEASGKTTCHALRKKGRPAARRTSGERRGKKAARGKRPKRGEEDPDDAEEDEGDAGDEEDEADEEDDAEEEEDEEDAEEEDADVGEEEKDEHDDE
ncbi:unnamed protein product [Closterium sp. NIES-53]